MAIFSIGSPMGRFPATLVAVFVLPLSGRPLSCHSHVLEDIRRFVTNVCRNQPLFPLVLSVVCLVEKVMGYQCVLDKGSVSSSIDTVKAWRFQTYIFDSTTLPSGIFFNPTTSPSGICLIQPLYLAEFLF